MDLLKGSEGFQCCNIGEGKGLHVLGNFSSVYMELQQGVKCSAAEGVTHKN